MKSQSNVDLLAILVGKDMAKGLGRKPLAEVFGFSRTRQMNFGEELASYVIHPAIGAAKELLTRCFAERMESESVCLDSPGIMKEFMCSKIGHLEHECFWCLWMDSQARLIFADEIFRGTLTETSVYPREIVKQALSCNASSVALVHNHPSGVCVPSQADKLLTTRLVSALRLVDVKVFDHLVVAGNQCISFAEMGLI